jgi:hypothetical protein
MFVISSTVTLKFHSHRNRHLNRSQFDNMKTEIIILSYSLLTCQTVRGRWLVRLLPSD